MRWKNLFAATRHKPIRRVTRSAQLAVESLESRELMTATPYILPVNPAVATQAILTTGDSVGGYRMAGIPDGLGAFDNGNGTFTLLMNHELGNTTGVIRDHGAKGAFVSEWIINKSDLSVIAGSDLMKQVYGWNTLTQQSDSATITFAFNRFCSGDLPPVSAYYNAATGLGTQERIYMHGEEGGATGFQLASVATGPDAGKSYILGKFNLSTNGSGLTGVGAWENALANPFAQDKTFVISDSDGGTGIMTNALAVYVGTKTNTGSVVDRAGLTNGTTKFVNVTGNPVEIINATTRTTNITSGTRFTLSGTSSTTFSRPEDGAWNPLNPKEYYFVTTDRLDQVGDSSGTQIGQTRLWRLTFDDVTNPDAGGKIDLLINGRVVDGQKVNMFDNITVNPTTGHIILLEDVGNAAHNGKVWDYNPATNTIVQVAKHDPARFGDIGVAATAPFNVDEETSGVIDASSILGAGSYLLVDQAHYLIDAAHPNGFSNPDELVEGGQLMLLKITPKVSFLAVGAGDATSTDAILWTRAQDITRTTGVGLMAQVSTDPTFAIGLATFAGITDPAHDYTIHVDATGLTPGTRYFYRFVADDSTISPMGTFVTAASATANVPVSLGFTGDADGLMRPYDATSSINFAPPTASGAGPQDFDYFVWLGDTIYESASGTGTPNFSPAVNSNPNVSEYWTKYRQQFLPVSTGSYPGLTNFFDSTGHYTLLDNHELGNGQYINGGAPALAANNTTDPQFDVNTTGTYKHDTAAYKTLQQAYDDYQPVRVSTVVAPTDPRSNGTQQMYFAQQWGANNIFINVDDRTNRDIRLKKVSGTGTADDTGDRADNPGRTMLGATELAWLETTLLSAQQSGQTWKIVATSSPIDQIGAIGSGTDGGKSWMGGYRAERNALMQFIADNHIDHVVFFSTDDHLLRVNEVDYFTQFTTDSLGYPAPVQSSYVRVPGALSIIAGPIGATGPDTVTDHSFANIQTLANALVASETAAGVDPIGLDAAFPGLKNVWREGDAAADTNRTGFDFYSPDTFNYATLNVSADGSTLSVGLKGINSYAVNTFPQPGPGNAVRDILSFQIGLETTTLTVPTTSGVYAGTTTLRATLTDSITHAPIAGKLVTFTLGSTVVGTAVTDANGVATLSNVDISSYAVGSYVGEIKASFNGDVSTLKSSGAGTLVVAHVVLGPDPANPNLTALFVGGSAGNDHIQIQSKDHSNLLTVKIDGPTLKLDQEVSSAVSRVVVYGGPGNDHIEVDNKVLLPVLLFGGSGDDHLQAGGGPTTAVGGAGEDHLEGGTANAILIGGADQDHLESKAGDGLLIGGTTLYDANLPALIALMTEWSRADESYGQRVANLQNSPAGSVTPNGSYTAGFYLTSSTVHDDAAGNQLDGGSGLDWYFANLDGVGNNGVKDKVKKPKPGEIVTTITL